MTHLPPPPAIPRLKYSNLWLAFLLLLLSSCKSAAATRIEQARSNSASLLTLELGTSTEHVLEQLGEGTKYVSNPHRSQSRAFPDGRVVLILHYYTEWEGDYRRVIPAQCLTPVVFEDGVLVGWGRQFFEEYVQKFEVRVR